MSEKNGGSAPTAEASVVAGPILQLKPLVQSTLVVPVKGITPVIPHKWSEKALNQMREKQSGKAARAKREPKDPVKEAEASCYYLPDGVTPGIPATAFKAAIVDATRFFEGITMVQARQVFFVEGEGDDQLVALRGERKIREDTPRTSGPGRTPDLRYRYAYFPWEVDLPITYVPSMIDSESVLALVNAAGMGGVGDWRPSSQQSKTGTFGRFAVDTDRQVQQVR